MLPPLAGRMRTEGSALGVNRKRTKQALNKIYRTVCETTTVGYFSAACFTINVKKVARTSVSISHLERVSIQITAEECRSTTLGHGVSCARLVQAILERC